MHFKLSSIQYDKLCTIGAGRDAVVVSDGVYAIKIGRISEYAVKKLRLLHKVGLSVPIYMYRRNYAINSKLIQFMKTTTIKSQGFTEHYTKYMHDHTTADILVSGLATPFISHDAYDPCRYEDTVDYVYDLAKSKGIHWSDAHRYNLGYYNENLVILDC